MKMNWKKVLLIALPIVGAGVAVVLLNRKKKVPTAPQPMSGSANSPKLKASSTTAASTIFPLKQGSNNDQVKKLQQALLISVDGIFGPQTAAALQSQFGTSTVKTQSDLDLIVKQATAGQYNSAAQSRGLASSLTTQFATGAYNIKMNQDYLADQVFEEKDTGNIIPTGMAMQLVNGITYNNTDYTLDGATELGYLIVKVNTGDLFGEYLVDPTTITLVPIPGGSAVPYTDASTGLTTF